MADDGDVFVRTLLEEADAEEEELKLHHYLLVMGGVHAQWIVDFLQCHPNIHKLSPSVHQFSLEAIEILQPLLPQRSVFAICAWQKE